jgi:hypothetical protein
MEKEKFSYLTRMLENESFSSGGTVKRKFSHGTELMDFSSLEIAAPDKKDFIVHVKYFKGEDRYGFSLYESEDTE